MEAARHDHRTRQRDPPRRIARAPPAFSAPRSVSSIPATIRFNQRRRRSTRWWSEYRELQPEFVLTHSFLDPYNPDHPTANRVTLRTRVYAQASGYPAAGQAARRAAGLPLRTASAGTMRIQAAGSARRHAGVGDASTRRWNRWRRRPISGSTIRISASAAAVQAVRNSAAQEDQIRGSVPARLSAGDERIVMSTELHEQTDRSPQIRRPDAKSFGRSASTESRLSMKRRGEPA